MNQLDPPEQLTELSLACLPVLVAALLAAASAATTAVAPARKAALVEGLSGIWRRGLQEHLADPTRVETNWLILRGLGVASSSILAARTLPDLHWILVTALVLVVYGVAAEVLSAVARRRAEQLTPFLLVLLRPLDLLIAPLSVPLRYLGRAISFAIDKPLSPSSLVESEVEALVTEGEMNGALAHDQSEMIRNVLDFGDIQAGDIMTPRTRVVAINVDTSVNDFLKLIADMEHSRYPAYRDRIDNVIGILHVKDLVTRAALGKLEGIKLADLVRKPVMYIPSSQHASSLLTEMRAGKHHMAIVIDEFGGMNGIITIEDLIEQIVGEIRDEHDDEEPPIVDLGDGRLMVDASMPINDLSRYLGVELPEDGNYNSVGGFIVERMGYVPEPGAAMREADLDFVVRDADERKVAKVEIIRSVPSAPPDFVPSTRPAA
jgi:CBS domain containing-hemolysin-like protein